jgi:hypothetical protein
MGDNADAVAQAPNSQIPSANSASTAQAANRAAANASGGAQMAQLGVGAGQMLSTKTAKVKRGNVPTHAAMKAIRHAPVDEWQYKKGQGDGGRHIGPYAEDMQKHAGNTVAPGGKAIDVISTLGLHHAAMQNLDQRLDKMESRRKAA